MNFRVATLTFFTLLAPLAASSDAHASARSTYVAECTTWGGAFGPRSCGCIFDDISGRLSADEVTVWIAEIKPTNPWRQALAAATAKHGQPWAGKALEKASVALAPAMGRCRVPLD